MLLLTAAAITVVPSIANAQSASNAESLIPGRQPNDQPQSIKDFLAKQRTEKAKKDHEELLKRGEEVVALTDELEAAFARGSQLSPGDMEKLESLEKLVNRIRKSLGGDDDDEAVDADRSSPVENRFPSSIKEAFSDLRDMSDKLMDELKKTTRFSVSVVAIQSTNAVLKLVRFLKLRK